MKCSQITPADCTSWTMQLIVALEGEECDPLNCKEAPRAPAKCVITNGASAKVDFKELILMPHLAHTLQTDFF